MAHDGSDRPSGRPKGADDASNAESSKPLGRLAGIPELSSGVVKRAARTAAEAAPRTDLPKLEEEIILDLDLEQKHPSSHPPERLPAICMYGRYEILGRIAFGGMAEIFLGRESTRLGASRYLVIKRILPHVADDQQFVQMFLDEARLAMNLTHPNICHIYEFGDLEGTYFIAMEWVNGAPLGKMIRKARESGGVPPKIAARVIATVAGALHYAHRARDALGRSMNIVHRDVTPHNVMVAYDGQVKLLDFGIAKASTHATKTVAGVVKGKYAYMAPEQCLGRAIDHRSDVFALGINLWETLAGRQLFRKENEYETMHAVLHDDPPLLRRIKPGVPEGLEQIARKALQKDPNDRYQTAGEMEHALQRWLSEAGHVVTASSVGEYMDGLFAEQIKRGPLIDSTPFGQSFQRLPTSQPSAAALSQTEIVRPKSRMPLVLLVLVLAVGLGGGYAFVRNQQGGAVTEVGEVAREPVAPDPPAPTAPPSEAADAVEPEPITTGALSIASTPPGASVTIDGEAREGVTPLRVDALALGPHEIVVALEGHRPWQQNVEVTEEATEVTATLVAVARREPAVPGRLSINTRPWSKVYVGRRLLGTTPIADARVPSGTVRLRLIDRDGRRHTKTVRVPPNGAENVFFDL